MKGVGWILDLHIDDSANIWVKLDNGEIVLLTDYYQPSFYIELKDGLDPHEIVKTISTHPLISNAVVEEKYVSILSTAKSKVIRIVACDTSSFRRVKSDIDKLNVAKSWFNTDIYHFQRYLFTQIFAPTSKVEMKWDQKLKLLDSKVINDFEDTAPPPFSTLLFETNIRSKKITPNPSCDPINKIILKNDENEVETLEGCEANILTTFSSRIKEIDPDFLISNKCEEMLEYILERADALSLPIQFGRIQTNRHIVQKAEDNVRGRAAIDLDDFIEYGLAGITELSRFTLAPPTFSAKWPAGKTIDARQSFEAMKKDILIPKRRGYPWFTMMAKDINSKDKGGLLFSPIPGLHENVAELDFESMFPNIIARHNISYETVTPNHVDKTKQGFLGEVVKIVLDRRLRFKRLRRRYPKNSKEYTWCNQRQKALKSILVCIYGFSGCFANRFNNLAVFNEINTLSRRVMVQTSNLCLMRGFDVLYLNTDAIYIKKLDATKEDYDEIARTIEKETNLPITVNHHFKFLVFMNQRTHMGIEAMNRFYGKLTNGELYYRGIEMRRRDCPVLFKNFQEKLIQTIFDARNEEQVLDRATHVAEVFTQNVYNHVINGTVKINDLTITKHLRKNVDSYRVMLPHVVAAKHLARKGKKFEDYSSVNFIYTNSTHTNPMRRVLPPLIMDGNNSYYDRERYAEILLDVADTILKPLGIHKKAPATIESFLQNELQLPSRKLAINNLP